MKQILVPDNLDEKYLRMLKQHANVVTFSEVNNNEKLLESVNGIIVLSWPAFLDREKITKMKNLEFIQSILVGVNHIPFNHVPENVIVCSNSGAYSTEVAEYAWALLLAASKKICEFDSRIKSGETDFSRYNEQAEQIMVLEGKNLGIIGYGGIGKEVAKIGRAFGMKIHAYVRRFSDESDVSFYTGREGLERLLRISDFVVLAIPLTRETNRMIGSRELELMKERCVLVNVGRGDLVDQEALYMHLSKRNEFYYATDVWWFEGGRETMRTRFKFNMLHNFIGTPHISGPTALARGKPYENAVENTIRYLKGLRPDNIVRREEY